MQQNDEVSWMKAHGKNEGSNKMSGKIHFSSDDEYDDGVARTKVGKQEMMEILKIEIHFFLFSCWSKWDLRRQRRDAFMQSLYSARRDVR